MTNQESAIANTEWPSETLWEVNKVLLMGITKPHL